MRDPHREMLHGNAETLVLAMLAGGEAHGYRLRFDLAERSRDEFQLSFGSLYPLLRAMESRGLVRSRLATIAGDARERRAYRLTARGRKELAEQHRRWNRFGQAMERVLRGVPA